MWTKEIKVMAENLRTVVEGDIAVLVKKPSRKDKDQAQIVYSKAWRKALDDGLITRAKLNVYLEDQGIWSDNKQKQYEDIINKINNNELSLKRGGIALKQAKKLALELKKIRVEFRDLIAERSVQDNNTAEGFAENAKFDYLVRTCLLDPSTKTPIFKDENDYDERGVEPWAIKAASELANLLYDLDPNYEKNLPENEFLGRFNFTNADGKLINKAGHLISIDEDGTERLIDGEGYFIEYDEEGNSYRINRKGERTQDLAQQPFLDDDGNPVILEVETTTEETKKIKKKKAD